MNSKNFLVMLLLLIILVGAVVGWLILKDDETTNTPSQEADTTSSTEETNTQPATETSDLATLAAAQASCGYTPEATAGPYYVSGTQALVNGDLNYDEQLGEPIKIGGYVYGSDANNSPVSGATIEIWHADNTGKYHPQSQGAASSYTEEQISLRGYVVSDSNGYYEFTSILPAEYEGRTRHIHVKATATGYQTRTSQIITYQPGDEVTPENDNVANDFPSCSKVTFNDSGDFKTAVFNFHIREQ